MRKLILTAIFSLSSMLFYAQDIKDTKGNVYAVLDSAGLITTDKGRIIGELKSNGEVEDHNNDIIGIIDGDDFKDADNNKIGSMNGSGEVYDSNNMKIGEIDDEFIKDPNGSTLAITSESINKKWLAAYYFFYFKNRY